MPKKEKKFDLNVEIVLANWKLSYAVREIISNAIDEQKLSGTAPVQIKRLGYQKWSIRDFGRGLQQRNFTQNENKEKIASKKVIGLFGVGLKDALAVFNRFKVKVTIHSKHLSVKDLVLSKKSNFSNISTLHAVFAASPRKSSNFQGTEFVLEGISDSVVETAKRLFLQFSPGQTILESTPQGQLLATNPGAARIYFNGVEVASEPNFLFSYNITELGENLKKNLNRERFNVGRTAYRKNIQEILLACKSKPVLNLLKETFAKYGQEELPEELSWMEVQQYVASLFNKKQVLFLTSQDLIRNQSLVTKAKESGRQVILISQKLKDKLSRRSTPITPEKFTEELLNNFSFDFVHYHDLSRNERAIFDSYRPVMSLLGGFPSSIKHIVVAQEFPLPLVSRFPSLALLDVNQQRIIVDRRQLRSPKLFLGSLIKEVIHCQSGYPPLHQSFEMNVVEKLGVLASTLIKLEE